MVAAAAAAAAAALLQSCPTLCNPIDGSAPGSPVPGILQARTLEWITWRLSLCNYSSSFLHHNFFLFHWFIPMSLKDIAVSTILQCFSLVLVRECDSETTPPGSIPNCHFKPLQLGSVPITPLSQSPCLTVSQIRYSILSSHNTWMFMSIYLVNHFFLLETFLFTWLMEHHPAQEGAGCPRLGDATGAFLASAPLLPCLCT